VCEQKPCLVRNCNYPARCRGMCASHYGRYAKDNDFVPVWASGAAESVAAWSVKSHHQRIERRGAYRKVATTSKHLRTSLQHKFFSRINERRIVSDYVDTPCWLWQGSIGMCGYGRFKHQGKLVRAHRFSYEHHVGPIPDGLQIDHLCFIRRCVNPDHLEPVTAKENFRRASAAGRWLPWPPRLKHPKPVSARRRRYLAAQRRAEPLLGVQPDAAVAAAVGVSASTIRRWRQAAGIKATRIVMNSADGEKVRPADVPPGFCRWPACGRRADTRGLCRSCRRKYNTWLVAGVSALSEDLLLPSKESAASIKARRRRDS
jgi:hypothetical protein